jgi:hypothetical protein
LVAWSTYLEFSGNEPGANGTGMSPINRAKQKEMTPGAKFCWDCGRTFRGKHYAIVEFKDLPEFAVKMHKTCAADFVIKCGGKITDYPMC